MSQRFILTLDTKDLEKAFNEIEKTLKSALKNIKNGLKEIKKSIEKVVKKKEKPAADVSKSLEAFGRIFKKVFSKLGIVEFFRDLISQSSEFKEVIEILNSLWASFLDYLGQPVLAITVEVLGNITDILSGLTNRLEENGGMAKTASKQWEEWGNKILATATALGVFIGGLTLAYGATAKKLFIGTKLGKAVLILGGILKGMGAILLFLISPLGTLTIVTAVVVGWFIKLRQECESCKKTLLILSGVLVTLISIWGLLTIKKSVVIAQKKLIAINAKLVAISIKWQNVILNVAIALIAVKTIATNLWGAAVKGIKIAITLLKSPFILIIAVIGLVIGAIVKLLSRFEWFQNMITPIVDGISNLWNGFWGRFRRDTEEATEESAKSVEELGESVKTSTKNTTNNAIKNTGKLQEGIVNLYGKTANDVSKICHQMGNKLDSIFLGINHTGTGETNDLMSSLMNLSAQGTSGVMDNFLGMENKVIECMTNLSAVCLNKFSNLCKTLPSTAAGINTATATEFAKLNSNAGNEMNKLSDVSTGSLNNLGQEFDKQMMSVNQSVQTGFDEMVSVAESSMNTMRTTVTKEMSIVTKTVRSGSKCMVKVMNQMNSSFNSAGQRAMNGLNAGLNAGRARVLNTARSIANEVSRTMKNALQINSPSRVMKNEVGGPITEGLSLGIESNADMVMKEAEKLSDAIKDAMDIEAGIDFGVKSFNHSKLKPSAFVPLEDDFNRSSRSSEAINNHFNISSLVVREEADIRRIARELDDLQRSRNRSLGLGWT